MRVPTKRWKQSEQESIRRRLNLNHRRVGPRLLWLTAYLVILHQPAYRRPGPKAIRSIPRGVFLSSSSVCGISFASSTIRAAKAGMNLKNVANLTLPAYRQRTAAANLDRSTYCAIDSSSASRGRMSNLKNCLCKDFSASNSMSFNESNTVEQMILDAVAERRQAAVARARGSPGLGRVARRRVEPCALGLRARPAAPASARRRDGGVVGARGADPAQPRDRRPARPRRRGDLHAARHPSVRAGRRPRPGQREVHGLAARREDDAFRPERRARHRAADRLRRARRTTGSPSPTSGRTRPARWRSGSTWCFWSTACRWSSARPRRPRAAR